MKKTTLALLVAMAPAAAFAQVELISGFNFGQFNAFGYPTTNGETYEPVGFIRSNYTNSTSPGTQDSGAYKGANGLSDSFSAGSAIIYWDGTNGSSNWDFEDGADISVVERNAIVAVNHEMVNGSQMFSGDDNNAGLRLNSIGGNTDIALVINTAGFADFDPSAFSQNNDFNFTFSAYAASGASASIEWLFNGTRLGEVLTVNAGEFQAFNVDLPAEFYGNANSTLIARVTGDLVLDNTQLNGAPSAIPEPSAFAALAGVFGLGLAVSRRRRAV